MKISQYASALFAVIVLLSAAGSAHAFGTTTTRDVVHSSSGEVVTNTFGNCVRTQWNAGEDECNPRRVVAVTEKQPQHYNDSLSKEDRTIYFAFNKATLTPDAKAKLDSMANVLKSSDNVRQAHIVGYADRIGSSDYNNKLSQRRAEAVRDYIVARGFVNTDVAETRWLGESEPASDCASSLSRKQAIQCLQPDRRVEVEIEFQPYVN